MSADTTTDESQTGDDPEPDAEGSPYREMIEIQAEVRDDGSVTIPKEARDYADIDHDDVVDIYVEGEYGDFEATDVVVDVNYRVTIPARKRDLYDVEPGQSVRVVIGIRGQTVGDLP